MAPKTIYLAAMVGLAASTAFAECDEGSFGLALPAANLVAPVPPELSMRPVRPDCLTGLSGPEQENCSRDELAAYGAAVEAWVAALNDYVTATNDFANKAAGYANNAIDYARRARAYADNALTFADCEAAAINEGIDE